jgi:hypothetical protein
VSAGNGKVFDLDPDVIFNPSVTSIGVVDFRYILILNLVSINTAWVKHDEVSISKDGERSYTKERFLEKVSNKWKLVGQTGHHYENNTRDTISIYKQ